MGSVHSRNHRDGESRYTVRLSSHGSAGLNIIENTPVEEPAR